MAPSGLDRVREASERATQERDKHQAEFDKFSRESMALAADNIEKSGMPWASEAAAALRRAYDPAGAQLAEAQKFCASGGGTKGLDIGIGGKVDISADKALGNSMLGEGSAKTQFGEGIDLGARLDPPRGFDQKPQESEALRDNDTLRSNCGQPESQERSLSLPDKSGTHTAMPESGLAARPAEPSAHPEQIDSFRSNALSKG